MKKGAAQEIFLRVWKGWKDQGKAPSLSALSKNSEMSLTSLCYAMKDKRKWTADNWLCVLNELKAIEVREDAIIIKFNIPKRPECL